MSGLFVRSPSKHECKKYIQVIDVLLRYPEISVAPYSGFQEMQIPAGEFEFLEIGIPVLVSFNAFLLQNFYPSLLYFEKQFVIGSQKVDGIFVVPNLNAHRDLLVLREKLIICSNITYFTKDMSGQFYYLGCPIIMPHTVGYYHFLDILYSYSGVGTITAYDYINKELIKRLPEKIRPVSNKMQMIKRIRNFYIQGLLRSAVVNGHPLKEEKLIQQVIKNSKGRGYVLNNTIPIN